MAVISQLLTDTFVKSQRLKPGSYSDGQNLYLRVKPTGARSWVFRYSVGGKVKEIGLGSYPTRKLTDARDLAGKMRAAVQNGEDPKSCLKPKLDPSALTFAAYAADFIAGKKDEHRSAKAHAQWTSTIKAYCGQIADKRPAAITYDDIKSLIGQPALKGKQETAKRVLQRVRVILDEAAKREHEPARFNPAIAVPPPKRPEVKHFAAAPYADVPTIMTKLREKDSTSALVLRFSIATAARSMNVRDAEWSEIDFGEAIWNIPGSKMKGGKAFMQPLNSDALEVLELAKAKSGSKRRVFPGPLGGLISDVAINKTLRSVYPGVTAHGFRSSFRDWIAEETDIDPAVAEMALAHTIDSAVEKAYRRGKLLEKRRNLMDAWAKHCSPNVGNFSNVVKFNNKAGN